MHAQKIFQQLFRGCSTLTTDNYSEGLEHLKGAVIYKNIFLPHPRPYLPYLKLEYYSQGSYT